MNGCRGTTHVWPRSVAAQRARFNLYDLGIKEVNEAYEVLKDPQKRQAYDQSGSGWQAGQEFKPPPNWNTTRVRIPPGVTHGQEIRLSGHGECVADEAHSGDLYLRVDIQRHRLYRLEHRDVYVDLPVEPWEAALGAEVPVPTLRGQVDLKIPAGSQSGRKLRLKGRGLPGRPAGDQYVVVQIVTPPADTETARSFYQKMAREMPFDPRAKMST